MRGWFGSTGLDNCGPKVSLNVITRDTSLGFQFMGLRGKNHNLNIEVKEYNPDYIEMVPQDLSYGLFLSLGPEGLYNAE